MAPVAPRVLVVADMGVHSGFGTVTQNIFDRLVANYGYDVHTLAINWRGDHWDTPQKLYLPTQKIPTDLYGKSRYLELLAKVVPDAIVFINDPAVVRDSLLINPFDEDKAIWRGVKLGDEAYRPPIIAYMPIDGYDSPQSWDVLASRVTRVAMTKFGRDTAMPEAPVVWHGVDTEVFRPRDKKESKRALGFDPDRFLVLRVDKNSTRKDYPASWKALRPLLRKYTDIDVHFHCLPRADDGYDMHAVTWNDEDIRDRVSYSPNLTGYTGWDIEHLATLYSAADWFLSNSWGEGFGLTDLEAMASGTPVVAQNHTALTEVVGDGGILIEPAGRISTPMGQDQCLPDIGAFTAAMERLYLSRGARRDLAAKAVEQASRFSWEIAAARFDEIIRKEVAKNALLIGKRSPERDQVEVPA
jgi:glycosyltransferase involved in cell wall biosynthesis